MVYYHGDYNTGLIIEMWKVTKVVEVKIDRLIWGFIPCIKFVDRPSYKSSTKEYDTVYNCQTEVTFPFAILSDQNVV